MGYRCGHCPVPFGLGPLGLGDLPTTSVKTYLFSALVLKLLLVKDVFGMNAQACLARWLPTTYKGVRCLGTLWFEYGASCLKRRHIHFSVNCFVQVYCCAFACSWLRMKSYEALVLGLVPLELGVVALQL